VDMLRKQAEPLEERAVALYSSGLERAKELRVFNKWTQLMTERLSVIRAAEYSFGKTPQYAFDSILESGFPVSLSLDKVEKKEYQQAGLGEGKEKKEESSSKEESK
jgi:hypothetical protein